MVGWDSGSARLIRSQHSGDAKIVAQGARRPEISG
jgi:hypothetical protein